MDSERKELRRFLEAHGVESGRSELMASQLQKRAEQLAAQRGIEKVAAMKYLLKVLVYGSRGEVYPNLSGEDKSPGEQPTGNPHKQAD